MKGEYGGWIPEANLPEEKAKIPCGCIVEYGNEMFVDGNGDKYTRENYMKTHGVDPKELWEGIKQSKR